MKFAVHRPVASLFDIIHAIPKLEKKWTLNSVLLRDTVARGRVVQRLVTSPPAILSPCSKIKKSMSTTSYESTNSVIPRMAAPHLAQVSLPVGNTFRRTEPELVWKLATFMDLSRPK